MYISVLQSWSRRFVGKFTFIAVLGLLTLVAALYTNVPQAHAAATATCSSNEQAYTVTSGDTLSGIASKYNTSWSALASRNIIANPDIIFAGQRFCIPGKPTISQAPATSIAPAARAASVAPAVPTKVLGPAQVLAPAQPASASVASMINSVFGPYAGSAMHIASCESGLNPGATNPASIGGSHAAGVFQILYPGTWSTTSQAGASPYNAYANIVAAHEIFVRDGYSWSEWSCR